MHISGNSLQQVATRYNLIRSLKGLEPFRGTAKLEHGIRGAVTATMHNATYTLMLLIDNTWVAAPLP